MAVGIAGPIRRWGSTLILAAAWLTPAIAQARDCAATALEVGWPGAAWRTAPPAGSTEAVAAFAAYALPPTPAAGEPAGVRTNAVAVIRAGRLVFEAYAAGFGADIPHTAWSVAKGLVHGLYGRAMALGLLDSLDRPVSDWLPAMREDGKEQMTLRHAMTMSSGLAWNEGYEFAPLFSDVLAMLYTRGSTDMAAYAASRPLAAPPGRRFAYSGGDSVLLMGALRHIVGAASYPDFPWTALFEPLGMRSAVLERDAAGTFVGSSYLYATAQDLARYGWLYAMDGCWAGQRLLPEGWTAYAGELAPAIRDAAEPGGWARAYGAHWWLNRPLPGETEADRPAPKAPLDMLVGSGHWGQRLFILPSQGLVLVRYGDDRGRAFSNARFLELALLAFAPDAVIATAPRPAADR